MPLVVADTQLPMRGRDRHLLEKTRLSALPRHPWASLAHPDGDLPLLRAASAYARSVSTEEPLMSRVHTEEFRQDAVRLLAREKVAELLEHEL